MISARMRRPVKVLLVSGATLAVAALTTACGTQKITVPKSSPFHAAAVTFSRSCSGCHTLSAAATHGSAANFRTKLITNGPNFDLRCERPAIRVLYALENGGFSGATMPQNIVVGEQAREMARFVATYAGARSAIPIGGAACSKRPIGPIPLATAVAATAPAATAPATTPTTTTTPASAATTSKRKHHARKKKSRK